jgi:hypothetical protein
MPHLPKFYQYCSPKDENKTSVNIQELQAYLTQAIWLCTWPAYKFYINITNNINWFSYNLFKQIWYI